MCLNNLDINSDQNLKYQQLIHSQKQMVDNLRNMASYVYQMADNMEKEIRLNAFQTRLVAQQKQDKIRQLASLLIQKQDLPDQNDKENQPHISNINYLKT